MGEKFIVTISHLLGCGGAHIGRYLAGRLAVPFVDRQILQSAADTLNVPESDIENRDERTTSFWQQFMRMEAFSDPTTAVAAASYPSDLELYGLEKQYIEQIVQKGSAVILGRGGRAILRDYPRHFSVFVCADAGDRVKRVSALREIPENEARRLIEKNDRERGAYMKAFAGLDWLNVRNYDLCVNTSSVGPDKAAELVLEAVKAKLGL